MNDIVSIIVPTYNSEATIDNCLKSIVDQTYSFKDVIVVDGASTDGTFNIVQRYQQKFPYIKWISGKDEGVYDAMNKGIDYAKGEFLFFMGSDDTFFSVDVLEKVSSCFSVDFIYGNVIFKHLKKRYSGESSIEKLIGEQVSICHQAIFYRKSIFKLVGKYDLKFFVHADYDLNVKCFEHPEVTKKYLDIIITTYNEYGISGTQSNKDGFHDYLTLHYITKYVSPFQLIRKIKRLEQELNTIKQSGSYVLIRKCTGLLSKTRSLLTTAKKFVKK